MSGRERIDIPPRNLAARSELVDHFVACVNESIKDHLAQLMARGTIVLNVSGKTLSTKKPDPLGDGAFKKSEDAFE